MNVWALDKDLSIKHLLLLLESEFDPNSYNIDIDTPTDPCAIFLSHNEEPAMRAYIFTLGQNAEKYGVHLEFPMQYQPVSLMESYENLSFKALADILEVHLDFRLIAP